MADGNATIRFVTDNAGPWFLHWYASFLCTFIPTLLTNPLIATLTGTSNCKQHFTYFDIGLCTDLLSGLAIVFAEDIPTTKNMDPPREHRLFRHVIAAFSLFLSILG